jgi:hypothetical protein
MEVQGYCVPGSIASQAIEIGRPSREVKVRVRRSTIVATNIQIKSNKII